MSEKIKYFIENGDLKAAASEAEHAALNLAWGGKKDSVEYSNYIRLRDAAMILAGLDNKTSRQNGKNSVQPSPIRFSIDEYPSIAIVHSPADQTMCDAVIKVGRILNYESTRKVSLDSPEGRKLREILPESRKRSDKPIDQRQFRKMHLGGWIYQIGCYNKKLRLNQRLLDSELSKVFFDASKNGFRKLVVDNIGGLFDYDTETGYSSIEAEAAAILSAILEHSQENPETSLPEIIFSVPDFSRVIILDSLLRIMVDTNGNKEAFERVNERANKLSKAVSTCDSFFREQIRRLCEMWENKDDIALILGETGTGKEHLIDKLVEITGESQKPVEKVNCSYFTESLLSDELFGHEKGTYTDAKTMRKGRIELAADGILFLDEIGRADKKTQFALLRFLVDRKFRRNGGTQDIKSNARLIFATSADLERLVSEGYMEPDFYYRIANHVITVPPLRERHEDIGLIAKGIVGELNQKSQSKGLPTLQITADAFEEFERFSWHGNVRQLEHYLKALQTGLISTQRKMINRKYIEENPPQLDPLSQGSSLLDDLKAVIRSLIHYSLSGGLSLKTKDVLMATMAEVSEGELGLTERESEKVTGLARTGKAKQPKSAHDSARDKYTNVELALRNLPSKGPR